MFFSFFIFFSVKYIVEMQIGMHNILKYVCPYEIIKRFVKSKPTVERARINSCIFFFFIIISFIRLIWPLSYCTFFTWIYILEIERLRFRKFFFLNFQFVPSLKNDFRSLFFFFFTYCNEMDWDNNVHDRLVLIS